MNTYLDVGAIRIQTWIARTTKLRYVRCASAALTDATGRREIEAWLAADQALGGIIPDPAAGDIAGVVTLSLPDAADPQLVATKLLNYLGERLPAVQWEGWWCAAADFSQAQFKARLAGDRASPGDAHGVKRFGALPSVPDPGLLASCDECRAEPRRSEKLGEDCLRRKKHSGNRTGIAEEISGRWPGDFTELARCGGQQVERAGQVPGTRAVGRRESRNHLATIAADGNSIGNLFDRIATSPLPLQRLRSAGAQALNSAAHDAVVKAAAEISGNPAADTVKAVIPHYVGGDDILVSVPAPLAWSFCAALGTSFESSIRQGLHDLLATDEQEELITATKHAGEYEELRRLIGRASLGVGMVFAHESHPFADTSALAEEVLHAAKKRYRGGRSAIGWIDLTEGDSRTPLAWEDPKRRPFVVQTADLEGDSDAAVEAGDVFALPPSARQMLADLLRRATTAQAAQDALDNWASRTNQQIRPRCADMPALLSRARWWPTTKTDEGDAS